MSFRVQSDVPLYQALPWSTSGIISDPLLVCEAASQMQVSMSIWHCNNTLTPISQALAHAILQFEDILFLPNTTNPLVDCFQRLVESHLISEACLSGDMQTISQSAAYLLAYRLVDVGALLAGAAPSNIQLERLKLEPLELPVNMVVRHLECLLIIYRAFLNSL